MSNVIDFEAAVETARSEGFVRFLWDDLYPKLAQEAVNCGWFPVEACALLLCHVLEEGDTELFRQSLIEDANRHLRETRCELIDLDGSDERAC